MMIIQVSRSHDGEQRKLFSDECMQLLGIRQEEYAGRQILYVHTALRWDEVNRVPGHRPLDITATHQSVAGSIDLALTYLHALTDEARRPIQVALHLAKERLEALDAPEMKMKAGKWFAVTEKRAKERREEEAEKRAALELQIQELLAAGDALDRALATTDPDRIKAATDAWRAATKPLRKPAKKEKAKA